MESKNIFFALASFLVFIIILSMLGVLAPTQSSKSVNVDRTSYYNPVSYWRPPYRKNIVYAPDVYVAPGPYARRFPNRRFYY